jgi:hypothetical protein
MCESSAYTMSMGRKGAILMLAVVALWSAAPALAFLVAAPCRQCCRAMIADCDPAMLAAHPCCQLQPPNAAVPPGPATATHFDSGLTHALVSLNLPDLAVSIGQGPDPSKAPPPRSLSGASSILRI